MDDETVERILDQMEKKFGEYRMEQGAKSVAYGKILIDRYLYGQSKAIVEHADQTYSLKSIPQKEHATPKQRAAIYPELKKEYGQEKT